MTSTLPEFIMMQWSKLLQTSRSHSRAGQPWLIMLCSETSDISTSKNESLLRSGSLNDRAYLSGIWQRANVTVCSEEENSSVEVGGEGTDEENLCVSVMVFPTKRGNM